MSQGKLSKLSADKVDLENQLEAEQEYVTNKLQKQLQTVEREKRCVVSGVCHAFGMGARVHRRVP